jgi:hypothetical protein
MQSPASRSEKSEYSYSQTVYVYNESMPPQAPAKRTSLGKKLLVIALVLAPLTVLTTFLFTLIFVPAFSKFDDVKVTFENFVVLSKEQRSAEAFALLTPNVQKQSSLTAFEQKFAPRVASELKNYQGIDWGRISIRTTTAESRYADLRGTIKGSNQTVSVRMYYMDGQWLIEMFTFGGFSPGDFAKVSLN